MLKPLLLGGSVALVLGAVSGGFAQSSVGSVVSSGPGSRLEVASYAAPVEPTPWAAGDATAPQIAPVAPTVWTATAQGPAYRSVAWTTPEPAPFETPAPLAEDTPELAEDADAPAPEPASAETPDPFALEPAAQDIAPRTEPDPDLIVAGLAS